MGTTGMKNLLICGVAAVALSACSSGSTDPWVGFGPDPQLTPPKKSLIPTVDVPKAVGWGDATPTAPEGFVVTKLGTVDHPRWLHVLPNGDVLVAQSSSEPKPVKGIRDWMMQRLQKRANALQESPNTITLLRDADGDGVAEMKTTFASNLKRPFGMALANGRLYVANDDGVVSFPYSDGQTSVSGTGTPVFSLPGGPRNHHWTKALIASPDGTRLYATVGSNSNVAENGMAEEEGRAAIHEFIIATGQRRVFASGLRNPNGMGFEPATGMLWTAVNERDEIGNDIVPDYMTSVQPDGFYGWPYSYFGQHVDARVKPPRPDLVAKAIKPDYGLGPHTASLGLAFYGAQAFPAAYQGGAFIGQHGSWNRKPLNGYRVVFVPFAGGRPTGQPQAFLTGFLNDKNEIRGRPVGVAVDGRGALLVADDAGDSIWRVAPAP